jgi:NADH dehydrogenase (ubiquinone) 1 beta subcomplex subunit 7
MREAKLPLAYRDSCAHLLIPLNRCRYDTYFLPWKCEVRIHFLTDSFRQGADTDERLSQNERHTYEKCQYDEFQKRVAKMKELREAMDGKRNN